MLLADGVKEDVKKLTRARKSTRRIYLISHFLYDLFRLYNKQSPMIKNTSHPNLRAARNLSHKNNLSFSQLLTLKSAKISNKTGQTIRFCVIQCKSSRSSEKQIRILILPSFNLYQTNLPLSFRLTNPSPTHFRSRSLSKSTSPNPSPPQPLSKILISPPMKILSTPPPPGEGMQ